jgi:hypothetical protein
LEKLEALGSIVRSKVDYNRLVRNNGLAQSKPYGWRRTMSYGGGGSYGGGSYGGGSYGGGGSYLGGAAYSGGPTDVSFQQAEDVAAQSNGNPVPLYDQNGNVDSYVYGSNSIGTPPDGPQVTTANGNLTITATDNAGATQAGGVYGHTLTFSEPGSNNLATITAASSTGLLVANPVAGNPGVLQINEYKGY